MYPQSAVRLEPAVDAFQRRPFDAVDALLGGRAARDEAGVAQHPEVLRNRRLAEIQRLDQVTDTALRRQQNAEDPASDRFSQDREGIHGSSIPSQVYTCQGMQPAL